MGKSITQIHGELCVAPKQNMTVSIRPYVDGAVEDWCLQCVSTCINALDTQQSCVLSHHLAQNCSISSANALEMLQSFAKPT